MERQERIRSIIILVRQRGDCLVPPVEIKCANCICQYKNIVCSLASKEEIYIIAKVALQGYTEEEIFEALL